MSNTTKAIVSAIAALALVGLIYWFSQPSAKFGASSLGTNLIPTTLTGGSAPTVFNALEATESFISDGPAYIIGALNLGSSVTNSVQMITTRQSMTTATTSPCSIQDPSSTSTLLYYIVNVTNTATSTNPQITIATSTTKTATTTLLANYSMVGTVQATWWFAPTSTAAAVMAPNNWTNVSFSGGTGTFSPTGNCSAVFMTST